MSYAITQRTRVRPSDGRWLLLAVVLHAAVFLVPLRELPPGTISHSAELVVRMVLGAPEPVSVPEAEKVLPEPEYVREVLQPRPRVAETIELSSARRPPPQPEPEPENQDISAARIMSLRDTLTERVPMVTGPDNPSSLGEPRDYTPPENWQPHSGAEALAPFDNTFNGMVVPEDVEIVDHWVATDGSQNVIVEAPNGLRLCGRAAPSDPMRPYIENVMHFHVCGGDGAIPFKFKPREPLNRDFIDPVAKDANQP